MTKLVKSSFLLMVHDYFVEIPEMKTSLLKSVEELLDRLVLVVGVNHCELCIFNLKISIETHNRASYIYLFP